MRAACLAWRSVTLSVAILSRYCWTVAVGVGPAVTRCRLGVICLLSSGPIPAPDVPRLAPGYTVLRRAIRLGAEKVTSNRFDR